MTNTWWGMLPLDTGVIVAELDNSDVGSYDFDLVQVRRSPDGRLWISEDSGCSCPSPFEYHSEDHWVPLTRESLAEHTLRYRNLDDKLRFVAQVERLL